MINKLNSDSNNHQQTVVMANLIGQVGCVTGLVAVVIVGFAFGAGWFLDDLLGNERRIVTVIFMLGSFPITLYAMVRISLQMLNRANAQIENLKKERSELNKEDIQL